MFGEGAQTFVGVSDGVPEWKMEYDAYCVRSKVAKQARLAKRLERKKEKNKEKNKARKARRMQREQSVPGASMRSIKDQASQTTAGGHEEDGGRDSVGSDGEYTLAESDHGVRLDDHGPEPVEGIWR